MAGSPVAKPGNRLQDHYPNLEDFETDLRLAGDRAVTIEAREFVRALNRRWRAFGERLYLSKNQASYLRKLANSVR